jgi:hypothetical protein
MSGGPSCVPVRVRAACVLVLLTKKNLTTPTRSAGPAQLGILPLMGAYKSARAVGVAGVALVAASLIGGRSQSWPE